ncbi:MAG: phosphatase family protein [Rhodocyclales bacterium]|nr:phosphatase family protein [Rhodocyclales bacterium]
MRLKYLLAVAFSAGTIGAAHATAMFQLDSLVVWRSVGANLPFDAGPPASALTMYDGFDNGISPPAGPDGATRYLTVGDFVGAEHGGVVDFSRSREVFSSVGTDGSQVYFQELKYNDSLGALNKADGFAVGATFNLAIPDPYMRYSVRLSDAFGPSTRTGYRNDYLDLRVRTPQTGATQLELYDQDIAATLTGAAFAPPAGATKVFLMFIHELTGSSSVSGYVRFLDDALNPVGDWLYEGKTDLFHGENTTNFSITAFSNIASIPEPQSYLLVLFAVGLLWGVRRRTS